jgi:pimeloyl-ACP methyl ester carboxylesterase
MGYGVLPVGRRDRMSDARTRLRRAAIAAASLAGAGAAVTGGAALWMSPGKPEPITDETGEVVAGSIVEKTWVDVNGVRQGMFLRGRGATKPVLLFVHGGPGMPEYFLDRTTNPTGLEDDFVVCWWEQRGAGISSSGDIPRDTMTVDQLVDDTITVADYLRERFHQDKVCLLAHSWGSFIGIQAAARAPDRFLAYVGMGQVSYQQRAEVLAYQYELGEFHRRGDEKMVRTLESAPVTLDAPLPRAYMRVRDHAMHSLGIGTTRAMKSVITGVLAQVWRARDYTLREKVAIGRGKAWSQGILWDEFQATDLTEKIRTLELPLYICQGRYDYTTNHDLARAYFSELRAPVKGFYTFEQSAHSPAFEEPEKFREILRDDVLAGTARLADPSSR